MYCGINWHTDVQKLVILDEMGMPFPLEFTVDLIPTAAKAADLVATNQAIGILQTAVGTLNTNLVTTTNTANTAKGVADEAKLAAQQAQQGLNSLPVPMKWEVVTVTLGAGGTANAVFAKTYTEVPLVIPMTRFVGDQMFAAAVGVPTITGVSVSGKRSRGTLLLTSGPFEQAASGDVVQFAVIGR